MFTALRRWFTAVSRLFGFHKVGALDYLSKRLRPGDVVGIDIRQCSNTDDVWKLVNALQGQIPGMRVFYEGSSADVKIEALGQNVSGVFPFQNDRDAYLHLNYVVRVDGDKVHVLKSRWDDPPAEPLFLSA